MKLYYIVQSEMLTGGVIEAQVIGALRAHQKINGQPQTKLIFLEPARVAFSPRARATLRRYSQLWPEGEIAIVPYISRFGDSSAGKSLSVRLARERFSSEEIIFHCRGPAATWSAHIARQLLKKGRVVFDVRGPHADETIQRLGFPWPDALPPIAERAYRVSMDMDKRAGAVADRLFTVSPGLKQYAIEKFGAPADRVLVVPSCVENLSFDEGVRNETRKEWGVGSSAIVFLYAGRLGKERLPAHMFRIFASVLRERSDSKFVLMTYLNQLADLKDIMARAGVPDSSIVLATYSRDEALTRMCGADVGMLFCEPAARYKDWFPIKFPEYLAAGLSLAMNSLVGVLPDLVRSRGLGWIMDAELDDTSLDSVARQIIAAIEENRHALRKRSLDTCSEMYVWRNHVPAIRRAYGIECVSVSSEPVVGG